MATKTELEERLDDLKTRIENLQNDAHELIEAVRKAHDAEHGDPWTVCRSELCRSELCRQAYDIQGVHDYLQTAAG